jgi:hypothetical protein
MASPLYVASALHKASHLSWHCHYVKGQARQLLNVMQSTAGMHQRRGACCPG